MDRKISSSVIGELILGELPFWQAGVCRVEHDDGAIVVRGENDHPVGSVKLSKYRDKPSVLGEGRMVLDLSAIADEVNEIAEEEHDEL